MEFEIRLERHRKRDHTKKVATLVRPLRAGLWARGARIITSTNSLNTFARVSAHSGDDP